ncbi:iron ABC transporter permease [Altererythrobacter sp. KTW20L]|uniref:ABC transporter permease n=1 Tax=Altererythrobacter sp. KTW20L TaxID=2942210 RepID=UPI0020BF2289|nr:iron ABC transporter permease [Altererythrobacter sp. KTW20L]MCL6250420.1 iron ABC transporter permease [Altererythrobacter sp. KTW20L]
MAAIAGLIVLLPLGGVILAAMGSGTADIAGRDIARYALTSAWLALLVGVVVAFTGTIAAWLVAMHRFPGRSFFAWALALPLAVPAFAMAYSYADLLDVAGPLRTAMRASLGTDLPFSIRSTGGAVFILSAAFYPYVYLAMRAAFINQSVNVLEAAAMLGCNGRRALWRVALPMARPALAAGTALAMMEVLADFGAVRFLNVQTLTTGIVRAWTVYGSTVSAARFALPLLAAAALLLWIERAGRKGRTHESGRGRWRQWEPQALSPARGWLAASYCLFLLTAGLLLPVGWLAWNVGSASPDWARLLAALQNSLSLAVAGGLLTVLLATMLALGTRRLPLAGRIASLGYATPGAVMAIGLLAPAGVIWSLAPGSGMAIAISLLLLAYAARLMAAALEPIDAGLARVTPSMVQAARTLGRSETRAVIAVDLPIARGAMLTAGLIVFIDILKELPATLILRPFNFDTLAVTAHHYAIDERLPQAGPPSLLILALSIPTVLWLTRRIALARPGT